MVHRPMFWISISMLLGMIFSHLLLSESLWLSGMLTLLILFLIALAIGRYSSRYGSLVMIAFAVMGALYYAWYDLSNRTSVPAPSHKLFVAGKVVSPVDIDGNVVRFQMELHEAGGQPISEKVQCRIPLHSKDEQASARLLRPGTRLSFSADFLTPQPARNPGAFDYKRYLYYQRIHWIIQPSSFLEVKAIPPPPYNPGTILYSLQAALSHSLEETFPSPASHLMKALILGIRKDVEQVTFDSYAKLGLTHVLAISGLHMTIIISAALLGMRWLSLTKETSLKAAMAFIPFYILLTGAAPSVVRSGIMAFIYLIGIYLHRPRDGLNVLGAALASMLLFNPYYLWDVGFQLSFIVTWGLLVFVAPIQTMLPVFRSSVSSFLSVTLTAQFVSFPIVVYSFYQYSLLSFAVNLLFVPVFTLWFIPFGFLTFLLGLVHPGLAHLLAKMLSQSMGWMNNAINHISQWSLFHRNFQPPSVLWLAFYYTALIAVVWIMKGRRYIGLVILGCAVFLLLPTQPFLPGKEENIRITFLDVGQGDAIVVEIGSRKVYLIDAGGADRHSGGKEEWMKRRNVFDAGKDIVLPYLKYRGINKIDTVIMTHGDLDHIGGLRSVVNEIRIEKVLGNGSPPETEEEILLLNLLKEKRIPLYRAEKGLSWQDSKEIKWTVLSPQTTPPVTQERDNDHSIVLLLEAFQYRFLFTGDLERNGEDQLLQSHQVLPVHVLKVAHHGSKTSTSPDWIEALRPAVSIISAGRNNRFGHPHPQTIETLNQAGSKIFRTDRQGAVTIEIDHKTCMIETVLQQDRYYIRQ